MYSFTLPYLPQPRFRKLGGREYPIDAKISDNTSLTEVVLNQFVRLVASVQIGVIFAFGCMSKTNKIFIL